MASKRPETSARKGSILIRILKGVAYAAVLGLLALVVAVGVAVAYLPSYGELTKRSDLGQMIRVRAANGQVLLGPGPALAGG